MTFDSDFKEALAGLPQKEKDKLILRLLKKDLQLANRLHFELLSTISVDQSRAKMEETIKQKVQQMTHSYYSPGYLLMDMRYLSGEINDHVSITKDKFGEASLNLLMLNEILDQNKKSLLTAAPAKTQKLNNYIVARTFKIVILISKLHQDYHIDFEQGIQLLGNQIGQSHSLMKTAIFNGLDVNWLLSFTIPENINDIHRDLRTRGYLK